jgi:hypothetical protein
MSRLTPESIRASQAELPPIGTVITELRRQDPTIQQEQHPGSIRSHPEELAAVVGSRHPSSLSKPLMS